jgi:hypothetical protein
MKFNKTCAVAVAGLASLLTSGYAQTLDLNFAANTGTGIQFNGASDSFQFISTNGYQWHVTSETGGSSSVGLMGLFGNGPFVYGPITSTGSGLTLVQQATVLSPLANFVINDGSGNLSGMVNFENIETFATASGALNANLSDRGDLLGKQSGLAIFGRQPTRHSEFEFSVLPGQDADPTFDRHRSLCDLIFWQS